MKSGHDGGLLDTFAARIPEQLWKVQILMPINIYHSWWAAGVSIDPAEAASVLYELSTNWQSWETMSSNAIKSAEDYNLYATASRFADLLESVQQADPVRHTAEPAINNPYHIDYSDIFSGHPTTYWANQDILVTGAGREFIKKPEAGKAPQLMLLANTITPADVSRLLKDIKDGANVKQLTGSGHQPMTLSIALKNNLITVINKP